MASHWPQQGQPHHQYPHAQSFPQNFQYHQSQPYQQPQYQQPQHFTPNVQYQQVAPPQYQQPSQQYSQPQPYQQQNQYSQVQQYPHAGQYPQVQSYQQPAQQYSQTQQPAYSNSHQPYVPQQYSSQQYPPQQQGPIQYPAHQQQYQHQAGNINGQASTAVNSGSCFNCGVSNHFAQNCPEPKRPNPAGALDPRNYTNPLKRAKSGGVVVTKFTALSHTGQVQGQPQGYAPSTYVQNNQPQYQGSYSAPTSSQTSDQAHQQAWQDYYQWQAYQQSQPQQQHPDTSVPSQPPVSTTQAATYASGSLQLDPRSPHAPDGGPATQPSLAGHLQVHMPQPLSDNVLSTLPTQVSASHSSGIDTRRQDQQRNPSVPEWSESASKSPVEDESALEELADDDLSLLDVPDLPKILSQHNKGNHLPNMKVSLPATLISMPLPANFVVADALYPIPPPGPEDGERCLSKYLRLMNSESLNEHIAASKFWKDHKDDTVFLARPDDNMVITIDEVRAQLKHRRIYGETINDPNKQMRTQSLNGSVRKDSNDVLTQVEKLEREIAEMKEKMRKKTLTKGDQASPPPAVSQPSPNVYDVQVKEEQSSPRHLSTIELAPKLHQDTEELLAALGVTGSPKPVTTPNRAYSGLQFSPLHDKSSNDARRSQEPRNGDFKPGPSDSGFLPPPPPPPPPPPHQLPSLSEGMEASPISTDLGDLNSHAVHANGLDSGNGYHITGPDGEVFSPDQPRYEDARGHKRSHNRRDSFSDEDDAPARRQEDDVTPKFKRRQPKVAAAYSRRW